MIPERTEPSIYRRAESDLRFIRSTMAKAAPFTAVPGWGGVAIGVSALATAGIAEMQPTPERWLLVWLLDAVVALLVGLAAMARKAARAEQPLFSGAGARFLLAVTPPLAAGVLISLAFVRAGLFGELPGVWLLLYGVCVLTGGALSVRPVVLMGVGFTLLGTLAILLPLGGGSYGSGDPTAALRAGDLLLALGFGGLHIAFGLAIARRYGG